jgi:hypothetical protein
VGQFFSPDAVEEDIPPRDVADYLEGRAGMAILAYFTDEYGPTAPRILLKVAADARGFVLAGIQICPRRAAASSISRFSLFLFFG